MKTTGPTREIRIMDTKVRKNSAVDLVKKQQEEERLKIIQTKYGISTFSEFQKRANIQMKKIVNSFLKYKVEELKLENYTDEEIENIIEELLYPQDAEYLYYSSSEDEGSIYSDDETF